MNKILLVLLLIAITYFGYRMGTGEKEPVRLSVHPEKEVPLAEFRSFAFIVYGCNQASWCERVLNSLFAQDYDYYRIVYIDDASVDGTYELAKQHIVDNHQDDRVILIRNETRLGPVASLVRAVESCLDREVVIPMEGKDWLSQEGVLARLNGVFQNPDVWIARSSALQYPSFEEDSSGLTAFYAALLKKVRLQDLFIDGKPALVKESYLNPILEMSGGRLRMLPEPLSFNNKAAFSAEEKTPSHISERKPYPPLAQFPQSAGSSEKTDIVAFSFDRPLQLYSLLESIQRYVTGYEKISVLYRASDERFARAFEQLRASFPTVRFIRQSATPRKDFKPLLLQAVFDSPSEYILFAVDDIIVKDFVDLNLCMETMKKTDAYGFYLRFGRHINHCYMSNRPQEVPASLPLGNGIFAWDVRGGEADWNFPNSLDMTLYRKTDIKAAFDKIKFKNPNSLEWSWAQKKSDKPIGLYFENSKIVNLPLNIVNQSDCRHMNFLSAEELLGKFTEGLKIDIDPLFRIENPSPHFDYIPDFVAR